MNLLLIKLVRRYQNSKGSNHVPSCIFIPSCSDYSILVLKKYNIVKAIRFILVRVYNCDSSKNIGGNDYP